MELRRLSEGEISPVHVTPDVVLPERLEVEITAAAVPHVERMVVTVECREGEPPSCARLELVADGSEGLTSESLRDVPIGRVVAAIARHYAYVYVDTTEQSWIASPERVLMPAATAPPAAQQLVDEAVGGTPGRRRVTDALLREVAEEYRTAVAERRHPTKAVQDRWFVSPATASRWVAKARERGHLGKVGGQTEEGVR